MIFVGGIHGVGKTRFCNIVGNQLNISVYSASELIEIKKNCQFTLSKYVRNIDKNQNYLLNSIFELYGQGQEFLLDGHFCLLNENRKITKISKEVFRLMNPELIILLTEKPEIIATRRMKRDGVIQEVSEIQKFQEAEKNYCVEIATELKIPFIISKGKDDLEKIIHFVESGGY